MTLDDDDKKWVRGEIGLVRTELREEISLVRTELRGEISLVRTELREEIAGVRQGLNDLRSEVRGGFEAVKEAFVLMAKHNAEGMATITAAIESQTRTIVDALVRERVDALMSPSGNGKPPKGGGEKT